MLEKSRISKGCYSTTTNFIHNIDDEIFFSKCIGNYYSAVIAGLIGANEHFQRGVMPFDGPLFDQPAKIIEAFAVIESIKRDTQLKAQEAERAKQKRGR
jgi:hypothetical protein